MKSKRILCYIGQKIEKRETIPTTFASNLLKKRKGNALYPAALQTKQAFKCCLKVLLWMSGKITQLLIRQGKLLTGSPLLSPSLARSIPTKGKFFTTAVWFSVLMVLAFHVPVRGSQTWTRITSSPLPHKWLWHSGIQNAWEGFRGRSVGSRQPQGSILSCLKDKHLNITNHTSAEFENLQK